MKMENNPHCLLCDVEGFMRYRDLPDRLFGVPGQFSHRECPQCGMVWLDPRPTPDAIGQCYQQYYTHVSNTSTTTDRSNTRRPLGLLRDWLRTQILCGHYGYGNILHRHGLCFLGRALGSFSFLRRRAVNDAMGELLPHFKPGGTILDIGCGAGDYLAAMQNLGWHVSGVEPDPVSAERARARGLEIKTGSLAQARIADHSFDQVTMRHVLEHLHDPVAVIKECFRILKKGGRLVLLTPNKDSLGHKHFRETYFHLDPPRHLTLFSTKAIVRLFQKSQFTDVRINTLTRAAVGSYNASSIIRDTGKLVDSNILPQKGRLLFYTKEIFLNMLGKECGEEIEVVAVK